MASENDVNPDPPDDRDPKARDPREELLRGGVEQYRLPPDVRDEILATMPSREEYERMFHETNQQGWLSAAEFFASIGIEEPEL